MSYYPAYPYPYGPYGPQYQPGPEDRLAMLERQQQQLGGPPFAPVQPQPVQKPPQFNMISVSNEEEAWSYTADWTGAKQYFINVTNGDIYVKWFDANVPDTFREVYKKTPKAAAVEADKPPELDLLSMAAELAGRFSTLENKIDNLGELINSAANSTGRVEISNGAKNIPGNSQPDHGSGNGSGKGAQQRRPSGAGA